MTLDEAIRHAEEVAKEQDKLCKRYDDASGYTRSGNEKIRTNQAKKCAVCAEEHRMLAWWLRDYKRLKVQQSVPIPVMLTVEDSDLINRQAVEDKLVKLCNDLEEIFANIRMTNVDESVCGLCEYDCPAPFECKGFDADECFKLADEIRHDWQSTKDLQSVKLQTGHWIWQKEDIYRCSECHEDLHVKEVMNLPQYKWCPMCDAKMVEPHEIEENK